MPSARWRTKSSSVERWIAPHPRRLEPGFARSVCSCYERMNERIILEFDGGSRGNPGPAGIGVVLRAQDGTPLVTLGRFIGRATNNVAEYQGLITALQE